MFSFYLRVFCDKFQRLIKIENIFKKIICLSFVALFVISILASFASSYKDILGEGQTKTYTIDGKDYEVTIDYIGSSDVRFIVNGEGSDSIAEGETFVSADGTKIRVSDILYQNNAGEIDMVEFIIYHDIHNIEIENLKINPGKVVAGEGFTASVELSNSGQVDEEDMIVRISVPELNIASSEHIGDIEIGEYAESEGMYLKIPKNTELGIYNVVAEVTYAEESEKTTVIGQIEVIGEEQKIENFTLVVGDTDKPEIVIGAIDIAMYMQHINGNIINSALIASEVYDDIENMENVIILGEVSRNTVIQKLLGENYTPKYDAELIYFDKEKDIIIITGKSAYNIRALARHISSEYNLYDLNYILENKEDLVITVININNITIVKNLDQYAFKRANTPVHKAKLDRIAFSQSSDNKIRGFIHIENDGDLDLKDTKVTISIPELNLRRSNLIRGLEKGDEKAKSLEIDVPQDTKPGMYMARITIHSDDYRRVKHMPVMIE